MKVAFTRTAAAELDEILAYTATNFPYRTVALADRIDAAIARISRWPESAHIVEVRAGMRMVPILRFPFKIFYRLNGDVVEIVHIHHASRNWPDT